MRIFLRWFILLIFLSFGVLQGQAQDGSIQMRFTATEASGRVFLDWTMDLGQTCNGIEIMRSTDNLNFMEVGNIAGVCGSPFDTVSYSFTDESPIPNQINYYQLILGTLGVSQTLSVEIIDLQGTGFQVRPNPISTEGLVYFSNDRRETYRLRVFSMNGTEQRIFTTRDEFFRLEVTGLAEGIYVFRIEADSGELRSIGKILVVR